MLKHPEPYVCHGCGTTFMRRHPQQTACNPKCRGTKLSPEGQAVVRDFISLCKSRKISYLATFEQITGRDRGRFRKFRDFNEHGAETREWYLTVFRKFIEDFRQGWYKLVYRRQIGYVERQQFPMQRVCPRRANMCKGGFNPGDCPRKAPECSLSVMLPPRLTRAEESRRQAGRKCLREMGLM